MYVKVSENYFLDAVRGWLSSEEADVLFEYLTDYEEQTGHELELDVPAFTQEFNVLSNTNDIANYLSDEGYEVLDAGDADEEGLYDGNPDWDDYVLEVAQQAYQNGDIAYFKDGIVIDSRA